MLSLLPIADCSPRSALIEEQRRIIFVWLAAGPPPWKDEAIDLAHDAMTQSANASPTRNHPPSLRFRAVRNCKSKTVILERMPLP